MFRPLCLYLSFMLTLSALPAASAEDNHIDTIRPDAPELARYGAYHVGVKTVRLTHRGQLDIARAKAGEAIASYDRPVTIELWYPASAVAVTPDSGLYRAMTRDGKTEVTLFGKAVRDAGSDLKGGPYPLLIVSHGYPGNRYLLSHLCENLASKGYVVASIDHADSTYGDQGAFGSTLLNRPLDQLFVLDALANLNAYDPSGTLTGMVDAEHSALIGYSMGGYGVLNTIGAGVTAAAVASPMGAPNAALAVRQTGNRAYLASFDKRIKAAIAIAPWGWNAGMWDAAGLAGVKVPVLFVAGSADDVSGYAPGVRNLFEGSVNAPRFLLTFENANHNAGAPIPAPKETWTPAAGGKTVAAEHYIDAVWDTARMNNILQHFSTAFLGKYLKRDAAMDAYLNLVEQSRDGKWQLQADGTPASGHTYWKGFANRTAAGLRFERRQP